MLMLRQRLVFLHVFPYFILYMNLFLLSTIIYLNIFTSGLLVLGHIYCVDRIYKMNVKRMCLTMVDGAFDYNNNDSKIYFRTAYHTSV